MACLRSGVSTRLLCAGARASLFVFGALAARWGTLFRLLVVASSSSQLYLLVSNSAPCGDFARGEASLLAKCSVWTLQWFLLVLILLLIVLRGRSDIFA